MGGLADFWSGFLRGRREELLREANRERMARVTRRAREADRTEPPAKPPDPEERGVRPLVRLGDAPDAPRIAALLQPHGVPRWIAFEERFILVEENGALVAAMRFREGAGALHLGLLVTDPRAEAHLLAVALYSRARATAWGLGLGEVRARTNRHEAQLLEAGYRRRGDDWCSPAWPTARPGA